MKAYLLLISFSIFFFTSRCQSEKSSENLSIIDLEANISNMRKTYLSEFNVNISYVPLESNKDYNFVSIMYMNISDKYILISDGRSCFLYDSNGRFIREIGKQGRGPGEYTLINYISMINERIYIHDIQQSDLIEYNINGTFEKRNKSGFTAKEKYQLDNAIIINDSMILGNIENRTGNEEYKALIIDKQGIVKYYFKNYILFNLANGNKSVRVPGRAIFYRFEDKVYFKEFLNDTLFQMDDKYQFTPAYVFNFGRYKHPLSDRGKTGIKWIYHLILI